MITRKQIDDFFNSDKIAFAGVSRNTKKFSRTVFHELLERGLNIIPINPAIDEIAGISCSNLSSLPDDTDSILIMTPKEETLPILKDAVKCGITNIWIQQGAENNEVLQYAQNSDLNIITKECIMMYAEPVRSVHKLHRFVWKLTGKYAS